MQRLCGGLGPGSVLSVGVPPAKDDAITTLPRTPLRRLFPALALLAAGLPASGQELTPAPDPAFSPAAALTAPGDGGCGCACEPEPCVQPLYAFGADPLDLSVSVAVADPRDPSRAHRLTFDLAPAGFMVEEEECVEDDAGRPMSLVVDEEEEGAAEIDCAGVRDDGKDGSGTTGSREANAGRW